MTKRIRKNPATHKATASAKVANPTPHSATDPVLQAAKEATDEAAAQAAAEARVEEETVESFRESFRRKLREDRARRAALRQGLSEMPLSQLLDRAADLILDSERLRAELTEWQSSRVVDSSGKRWRSEHGYVEALSTELDSQRARCEELQGRLEDLSRDRHREESEVEDRIGALITEEKRKFAAMEERYADALSAETLKKNRLELNTVTLLESLQLIGVGSAGPARSRT